MKKTYAPLKQSSQNSSFLKHAATLAFVACSLSGSLCTQALATDYTNPLGSTDTGVYMWGSNNSFSNAGNVIQSSAYSGGGLADDTGLYLNGAQVTSVFNSGIISAASTGTLASFAPVETHGVFLNGATVTTFTNTGIITASSSVSVSGPINLTGIFINGGTITTLNNSGTISAYYTGGGVGIGREPYSIYNNGGTIGTLNLLVGSSIIGEFQNYGTIGTLNVYKSVNVANFDSANLTPLISGNQPGTTNLFLTTPTNCAYISAGGHAAGVDKTAFGASVSSIRKVSSSIARLANTSGLIQSIGAKAAKHAADPYTMTSDLCADGAQAPAVQTGSSDFWIRGFSGRNNVDASTASVAYVNSYAGGAIGLEKEWLNDVRAGAFIGTGKMSIGLDAGLGGTDSSIFFLGTYATKTWGNSFAKIGLTGGHCNNTSARIIAAATTETATGDYGSWYVSPEIDAGHVYDLGRHLGGDCSLTPVLSARYVYSSESGYTETGATNNLTLDRSNSSTFEERAELKFGYATRTESGYGVKLNASVGGIAQQNNDGTTNGTLLGSPLSFATPGQDNSTGFVGGIGFEVSHGKYTFTASSDYVRLSGGNADLSANVVFSVKF